MALADPCWGEMTKRARVRLLLDVVGDEATLDNLANRAGCSVGTACEVRRKWRALQPHQGEREPGRCGRCSLLGWERNPVDEESGLCLWCRLEGEGLDLRKLFESGVMEAVLGVAPPAR